MPKSSDPNRWRDIDAARAHKGHFVRLDDEEQGGAEKLVKQRKLESVASLLRGLLRNELGLGPKARK